MREYNFGNLAFTKGEMSLSDKLWSYAFNAPFFDGPIFAPQPGPFFAVIDGTAGDDVLTGTSDDDTINGLDGDDDLFGGDGDDTLNGGDGNDILNGGSGADTLNGGAGVDTLSYEGSGTGITLNLRTGLVRGAAAGDVFTSIEHVIGTDFNDNITGRFYQNLLLGGGGDDVITQGGGGARAVYLSASREDYVFGQNASGQNTVTAIGGTGEGVDTLIDIGTVVLGGMNGTAYSHFSLRTGVFFLTSSDDIFEGISMDETVRGWDGNDSLYGRGGNDTLQGERGNDFLDGGTGNDVLEGGSGDDIIDGGAGADVLDGWVGTDIASYASASEGVIAIIGDAANDTGDNTGDAAGDSYIDIENITGSDFDDVLGGNRLANVIDGGAGLDVASYRMAYAPIIFDALGVIAMSGDIKADTLVNIEAIGGTRFNDQLFGDNGVTVFYGDDGADRLFGRNGDDELYGEDGNDIILGGRDNDLVDGGAGNDQLRGNEGDDTIFGGDGNDAITGGAGADAMDGGAGIDRVEYTYGSNAGVTASLGDSSINTGDAAGDTYVNIENLYGTSFNDELHGDAGNNRIEGRVGDDMLFGGEGNDYLLGGSGDDVLNGEGGNDLFLGQAGADIYQFDAAHGTDRIFVFTQGEDLIEFTENVFDFSGLTITQDGAHVNIVSSEGAIIVNNSLVADFASDDFIFASPPSQEPLDIAQQDMAMFIEVDALI